jgi:hypothetical protein
MRVCLYVAVQVGHGDGEMVLKQFQNIQTRQA